MSFDLAETRDLLARTPGVLEAWLRDLPDDVARRSEGAETWSAFDVVGHLVHGERTDWMPRARIILDQGERRSFEPFDRFAQLATAGDETLDQRLGQFSALRARNLGALDALRLTPAQLELEGRHPELGTVTLGQLLATWAAHDLTHLAQVARVLARGYAGAVGPWRAYLPLLGT